MKKVLIILLVFIVISSFSLIGIGCKKDSTEEAMTVNDIEEETVEPEVKSEETKEETNAEEVIQEPKTIVVWTPGSIESPQYKYFEAINKITQEKYNITLDFQPQTMDTYFELLSTSMISKSGPDIFMQWNGIASVIQFGRDGLFLPHNDLISEELLKNVSGWSGVTDPDDGTIWSVPWDWTPAALTYNKVLFEEAGIDFSDFPKIMSWDEFTGICEKLKNADIVPLAFANKQGYFGEWWLASSFGSYFDSNKDMAEYYANESMNSYQFKDACEKFKGLYDSGYFYPGGLTLDFGTEAQSQFATGKVAMQMYLADWWVSFNEGIGDGNVGITAWPNFSDEGKLGSTINGVYGTTLGITSWSKEPEAAMKVLEVVLSPEGAKLYGDIVKSVPLNKSWKPEFEDPDLVAWLDFLALKSSEGEVGDYGWIYAVPEYQGAVWQQNPLYLSGDMTFEELAEELNTARDIK